MREVRQECSVRDGAPVLDRQFLFTVYLHPHKDYPGYQPGSVFYGRQIADRIPVRALLTTARVKCPCFNPHTAF